MVDWLAMVLGSCWMALGMGLDGSGWLSMAVGWLLDGVWMALDVSWTVEMALGWLRMALALLSWMAF